MEKEINFAQLSQIRRIASEYSQIDDAYIFVRMIPGSGNVLPKIELPTFKVDGHMIFVLLSGKVTVEYNFERFEIDHDSIFFFPMGTFISLNAENWNDINAYILFLSPSFLRDININLSAFNGPILSERRTPCLELDTKEMHHLVRYLDLLHLNAVDSFNPQINKYIASSLAAALFYQSLLFIYKRLEASGQQGGRRSGYVHDFLKLVNIYYTKERSVSFYASKLFISPKYLSLLVKEATGKSAAKWIDEFVIMEAKNLLRFSGKNIQQVAYALNFSNQSSFGKYFKHLTGMSPTEYQNS